MATQELHPPGDELLSAWLDGELDETTHARVQAWLELHPEDAARVRLWAADREALRSRLDADLDEPVPSHWADRVMAGSGRRGGATPPAHWQAWAAMLALASALTGAAGGAWWTRQHPAPSQAATMASTPWPQLAAAAHAVYVPEVRHPVEVAVQGDAATQRAQEEHLSRWLTKRLDVPVKLFDLSPQGFRLVGGRLLPEGQGPSAQLMYEGADGVRVTVYLRRKGADAPAAFRYERVKDLGLFYWVEGPTGYAIVGPLPRERLLALAEAIARQEP